MPLKMRGLTGRLEERAGAGAGVEAASVVMAGVYRTDEHGTA